MSQLSFGFEVPEGHVVPDVPPARSKTRKKAVIPTVQPRVVSPVAEDSKEPGKEEVESMAKTLSAHPDYKVLRRLQPCLDY